MTAPDPSWRDRAYEAETERDALRSQVAWWSDEAKAWALERDALATRCAELGDAIGDSSAKWAAMVGAIDTKLDIAVGALCSIGNSFAWGENTGVKRSIRGLQEEARAAIAKIAAKDGP